VSLRRPSMVFALLAVVGAWASACGARSPLDEPDVRGEAGASADAGPRSCGPDCTVGHHCCQGSCDGPSVDLPNDCCVCIAGEVSSFDCPDDRCGGD
jgi:hypothetical protein